MGRGMTEFGGRWLERADGSAEIQTPDAASGAEGAHAAPVQLDTADIRIGDRITVYTVGVGPSQSGFTGVVLRATPTYLHLGLFAHEGESMSAERPIVAEAIIRFDQIACVVRRIA
ncbi:hypothetical protein SAMN05421799_106163 [Alicyclobacillus vulcanalis]|uniref:Uncharacterized protein n=2 Tax=Alicyclobacillus vulcanalis TaxID=252246 RepID=A0A1N7MVU4_9BACL|nr:hypothetical protein SAMN05421799_106163 [Alicyclobacillus vulcanalis]